MNEKEYHKKRRMFFLINNELVLPESGSDKSHMEWLLSQGKTINEAKNIIDNNLRGVVNPDGNIRFYIGENWEINEEIEKKFFEILPKIVEIFKISPEAIIGGGTIKGKIGDFWKARKEYGKVKDYNLV
ncbi:hypothetical protein SDC9_69836 [bioreactor metagenome]|uniref:Uncharacterized protein n=1 Tax=bioreactor metagenome TaxID=1076179 RepID=A0A644YB53_9ZZZZ